MAAGVPGALSWTPSTSWSPLNSRSSPAPAPQPGTDSLLPRPGVRAPATSRPRSPCSSSKDCGADSALRAAASSRCSAQRFLIPFRRWGPTRCRGGKTRAPGCFPECPRGRLSHSAPARAATEPRSGETPGTAAGPLSASGPDGLFAPQGCGHTPPGQIPWVEKGGATLRVKTGNEEGGCIRTEGHGFGCLT